MEAIIKTPTPDIKKSLNFYNALDYVVLIEEGSTLVTDGKVVIQIDQDRFARAGIIFYQENWDSELMKLRSSFSVVEKDNTYITTDPSGIALYLKRIEDYPGFTIPRNHQAIPGIFSGLSIESLHFDKSVEFWSIFDYKITMGKKENGWIAMANKTSIGIGIMMYNACPHLFFNPSFTYFNGNNNLEVIEKIRQSGIEITEEITHFNKEGIVDNIIIRDPGGYGFFIFSD